MSEMILNSARIVHHSEELKKFLPDEDSTLVSDHRIFQNFSLWGDIFVWLNFLKCYPPLKFDRKRSLGAMGWCVLCCVPVQ